MNERDARVSEDAVLDAYRALATEAAPQRLDAPVLERARRAAAEPKSGAAPVWLRPLVLAATIALCVAVVLDLTVVAPGVPPQPPVSGSSFPDAAQAEAERVRALSEQTGALTDEARDPPNQMAPAAIAAPESTPSECSASDRDDAASWWRCVRELEQAGRTDAAERELVLLLRAYPQFAVPR